MHEKNFKPGALDVNLADKSENNLGINSESSNTKINKFLCRGKKTKPATDTKTMLIFLEGKLGRTKIGATMTFDPCFYNFIIKKPICYYLVFLPISFLSFSLINQSPLNLRFSAMHMTTQSKGISFKVTTFWPVECG